MDSCDFEISTYIAMHIKGIYPGTALVGFFYFFFFHLSFGSYLVLDEFELVLQLEGAHCPNHVVVGVSHVTIKRKS